MVKIRLRRGGRKKRPFFTIVATDVRKPRDSGYLEKLGTYNPLTKELALDAEALEKRLSQGAFISDSLKKIIERKQQQSVA